MKVFQVCFLLVTQKKATVKRLEVKRKMISTQKIRKQTKSKNKFNFYNNKTYLRGFLYFFSFYKKYAFNFMRT